MGSISPVLNTKSQNWNGRKFFLEKIGQNSPALNTRFENWNGWIVFEKFLVSISPVLNTSFGRQNSWKSFWKNWAAFPLFWTWDLTIEMAENLLGKKWAAFPPVLNTRFSNWSCTISMSHARIGNGLRNDIEQLCAENTLHSILCLWNMLPVT